MITTSLLDRILRFDADEEVEKKKCLILFSAIICIAAVIFIIVGYEGEAFRDYFYTGDALMNGIRPYEPYNDLNWEYPPLTYLILFIPRLFASDPDSYRAAFVIMMTVFVLIGLYLVRLFALRYSHNAKVLMIVYTTLICALSTFAFDRFDMVVAVLTLSAIYLFLEKRYTWAFLLIAAGMMIKLYPGLLFPVFLIALFASKNREWIKGAAVFIIFSGAIVLFVTAISSGSVMTFLSYHTDRGLQIESIASSFVLLLEMIGLTSTQTISSAWAADIQGGIADMLAPAMMPILIFMVLLFCFIYYIQCRGRDEEKNLESVALSSFAVILIFIVFNKVYSGQYIVWLLAVIPFIVRIEDRERSRKVLLIFSTLIIVSFYYSFLYEALSYHEPFAVILILFRNILTILLLFVALRYTDVFKDTTDLVRRKIFRTGRSGDPDVPDQGPKKT